MPSKYFLEAYGLSDIGLVRKNNEDSFSAQSEIGFFIVADGLGGYAGGDVASGMLVDSMVESMHAQLAVTPLKDFTSIIIPVEMITIPVRLTNDMILNTAELFPQYIGMSTTLVSLLFYNKKVVISNVGDSRAYCLRNGKLYQLSIDHVVYGKDDETGKPRKFLSRAIGVKRKVSVDSVVHDVFPDDIYILCSDGLTDSLCNNTLLTIISENANDVKACVNALISKAKEVGSNDNITVISIKITDDTKRNKNVIS